MWKIVTDSGKSISEDEMIWPRLPETTRISALLYRSKNGVVGKLEGFEAYGFQRSAVLTPDGQGRVMSVQLIGVKGDDAKIVDMNDATGERLVREIKRSDLTYDKRLIRDGVGG